MSIRFLLVDALNLIRRVYAAQPGDDGPERAEGAKTSSVQSLQRALREAKPTHALVVFEGPEPSWRHLLFRDYKIGHKPMPEALRAALPAYQEAFQAIGVGSFSLPKVEADDVVATLAVKVAAAKGTAVILSTDKIFLQLLSDNITVRDHFGQRWLDRGHLQEKFGVAPEKFVDLLALAGDTTNAIPGVPGIGPKTAAKLIDDFGSLAGILGAAGVKDATAAGGGEAAGMKDAAAGRDEATGGDGTPTDRPTALTPRLAGKLVDHAEDARLAESLVRLQTDLDLGLNLRALRFLTP